MRLHRDAEAWTHAAWGPTVFRSQALDGIEEEQEQNAEEQQGCDRLVGQISYVFACYNE
jgi:hypothetical protein